MALNLHKRERSTRVGIKAKRKKAGWDRGYLLKVLYPGKCDYPAGETLELPTARRYHMLRDARIGGDTFEIYKLVMARALVGDRVDLQG